MTFTWVKYCEIIQHLNLHHEKASSIFNEFEHATYKTMKGYTDVKRL